MYEMVLNENFRKGERSDTIIMWSLTALAKLTIRLSNVLTKVRELIE